MVDPAKEIDWQREFKFPFQNETRSIQADGLTDDQFRLLSEICIMHNYNRGWSSGRFRLGEVARAHFTDHFEHVLTAFHTYGVSDSELLDFAAVTQVGLASRLTVERWYEPLGDPGWIKTIAGHPLDQKSHVMWMGASATGWFKALVGRSKNQFAQAMSK